VIVEFFVQHWIKYMLIVHARDGRDSEGWKTALDTIDQLLWSCEPKATPEERRKLASSIPGILKRVREGVTAAAVEQEVSTAFFGALMKCHTEVMQALPSKAKEKEKVKEFAGRSVDSSGKMPVAKMPGVESTGKMAAAKMPAKPAPAPHADLLDFTAPVVVANPFGEGNVQVATDDLDFTAATAASPSAGPELEPTTAAAAPSTASPGRAKRAQTIPLPARLVVGTWVEITDADEKTHYGKLHFVSPMKSHFLFVDRKGNKVYECSRSMLARRIESLEIVLLDGEPDASLFDRIMTSLFGKLGQSVPA
jgi:hypothetical protein